MSTTACIERPATDQSAPMAQATRKRRRNELTEAQRDLAARHVPLARTLSRPLKEMWPTEKEDFESASCFALVEAAQSFDPSRNVRFATFARFRIVGALMDVQRRIAREGYSKELPNVPRVFRYIPGEYERGVLLMTSPDTPVDEVVASIEQVEHWLDKLPSRHALACREIYLNYRTQGQVATGLGCAKSRVSCLHAEAMGLLRQCPEIRDAAIERGFDVSRN